MNIDKGEGWAFKVYLHKRLVGTILTQFFALEENYIFGIWSESNFFTEVAVKGPHLW